MSSKNWRSAANICTPSFASKTFNCDSRLNNQAANDDLMIIWCDTSINKNEYDDQQTLSQLHDVSKHVITFTDEQGCLEYIDKTQERDKLMLIVSGSLGESFVPKICRRLQIYLIYIFCGKKSKHEYWAKKYEKIKGVFDNITELREDLERKKQTWEKDQMCRKIADLFLNTPSWPSKFQQAYNINNPKHNDDHQPKDDVKKPVISVNVPFSNEVSHSTIEEIKINNDIHYSETVAPYMHYKQQMEFADTGIWPCVSVINDTRTDLVTHLHSAIEHVQYFNSTENFLQHFNNRSIDPHFIVLLNPIDIGHVSQLIHPRVRRLYIYCSNNRLNEYDAWRARYPHLISVLQHVDTLTRLILWDLSACIVDIGNYYDSENKKDFAQTRYRYAYRLHHIIQGNLNNRMEMIEFNQSLKLNN